MFQLCLFYDMHDEEGKSSEAIYTRCINCNKDTGLHLKDTPIEDIITKFALNSILHHVGMS